MNAVVEADQATLDSLLDEGDAVIVEFWAPWCSQCKAMSGTIERLAETVADRARVVTVNVEDHPEAAQRHDVQTLPALLLFREGELLVRLDGFKRLPKIMEQLRSQL